MKGLVVYINELDFLFIGTYELKETYLMINFQYAGVLQIQ
jgi:hypothetical protein